MSKRKRRQIKTTLFIVCEGTKTETYYFQRIKEQLDSNSKYGIEIHVYETDTVDPKGLVDIAIEHLGKHNEVWAVFDKDKHPKLPQSFSNAARNKVHIAFSSVSFEHWVLLHFEQNQTAFDKSADIIEYMDEQNIFDYEKSDPHLYSKTKNKLPKAFENAAWLRFINPSNGNLVYTLNPYTDVDLLIAKLLQYDKKIAWVGRNQTMPLKEQEITISYTLDKAFFMWVHVLIRNGSNTQIINNINLNEKFYILDNQRNKHHFQPLGNPIMIEPNQSQKFVLKAEDLANPPYVFNFETDKERVMMLVSQ